MTTIQYLPLAQSASCFFSTAWSDVDPPTLLTGSSGLACCGGATLANSLRASIPMSTFCFFFFFFVKSSPYTQNDNHNVFAMKQLLSLVINIQLNIWIHDYTLSIKHHTVVSTRPFAPGLLKLVWPHSLSHVHAHAHTQIHTRE